jgi:hypothetical protein
MHTRYVRRAMDLPADRAAVEAALTTPWSFGPGRMARRPRRIGRRLGSDGSTRTTPAAAINRSVGRPSGSGIATRKRTRGRPRTDVAMTTVRSAPCRSCWRHPSTTIDGSSRAAAPRATLGRARRGRAGRSRQPAAPEADRAGRRPASSGRPGAGGRPRGHPRHAEDAQRIGPDELVEALDPLARTATRGQRGHADSLWATSHDRREPASSRGDRGRRILEPSARGRRG